MVYIALMLGMSHVTPAQYAKIYFLKCRGYLIKSHSSFVSERERVNIVCDLSFSKRVKKSSLLGALIIY